MSNTFYFDVFQTAIGSLTVAVDESGALTEVWTSDASSALSAMPGYTRNDDKTGEAKVQLLEYAEGKRRQFDLRLAPKGTPFQHRVWHQLVQIPYGETRTYGQLAAILGNPNASRAVGRANGTNPIGIVVPCHRVIGTDGSLTGYAGGLPMKQRLLELEGARKPRE